MDDDFVNTVRSGNINEVKKKLNFNDVNGLNNKKMSGLFIAAQMNMIPMVEFLLSNPDLDVNLYNKGVPGQTALMIACNHGHIHVVKALLNHPEIDVNRTSDKGWTALMYASHLGHEDVVKWLLYRKDVDLSVKGMPDKVNKRNEFFTAKQLAERARHLEIVELIEAKEQKLHLETEVGSLLDKQGLGKYANTLYDNGIYTTTSAKVLTQDMLEDWGIVLPAVKEAIIKVLGGQA